MNSGESQRTTGRIWSDDELAAELEAAWGVSLSDYREPEVENATDHVAVDTPASAYEDTPVPPPLPVTDVEPSRTWSTEWPQTSHGHLGIGIDAQESQTDVTPAAMAWSEAADGAQSVSGGLRKADDAGLHPMAMPVAMEDQDDDTGTHGQDYRDDGQTSTWGHDTVLVPVDSELQATEHDFAEYPVSEPPAQVVQEWYQNAYVAADEDQVAEPTPTATAESQLEYADEQPNVVDLLAVDWYEESSFAPESDYYEETEYAPAGYWDAEHLEDSADSYTDPEPHSGDALVEHAKPTGPLQVQAQVGELPSLADLALADHASLAAPQSETFPVQPIEAIAAQDTSLESVDAFVDGGNEADGEGALELPTYSYEASGNAGEAAGHYEAYAAQDIVDQMDPLYASGTDLSPANAWLTAEPAGPLAGGWAQPESESAVQTEANAYHADHVDHVESAVPLDHAEFAVPLDHAEFAVPLDHVDHVDHDDHVEYGARIESADHVAVADETVTASDTAITSTEDDLDAYLAELERRYASGHADGSTDIAYEPVDNEVTSALEFTEPDEPHVDPEVVADDAHWSAAEQEETPEVVDLDETYTTAAYEPGFHADGTPSSIDSGSAFSDTPVARPEGAAVRADEEAVAYAEGHAADFAAGEQVEAPEASAPAVHSESAQEVGHYSDPSAGGELYDVRATDDASVPGHPAEAATVEAAAVLSDYGLTSDDTVEMSALPLEVYESTQGAAVANSTEQLSVDSAVEPPAQAVAAEQESVTLPEGHPGVTPAFWYGAAHREQEPVDAPSQSSEEPVETSTHVQWPIESREADQAGEDAPALMPESSPSSPEASVFHVSSDGATEVVTAAAQDSTDDYVPVAESYDTAEHAAALFNLDDPSLKPRFAVAPKMTKLAAVTMWLAGVLWMLVAAAGLSVTLAGAGASTIAALPIEVPAEAAYGFVAFATLEAILLFLCASGISRGVRGWWRMSFVTWLPMLALLPLALLCLPGLLARSTREWVL